MILNDPGHDSSAWVRSAMGYERSINAFFDERSSDAAINGVHILNDSGFDGPFTTESSIELLESCWVRQVLLLLDPNALERLQFTVGQSLWVLGQIRNRVPLVRSHYSIIGDCRAVRR